MNWCSEKFSLAPAPDSKKFPSNGLQLCDLPVADFESRAGNERSGRLLAKHLAHLRHSSTGRATSPLNIECKVEQGDEDDGKS